VAVSASAALETVHALALEVPAPATREVATALARAALEAAPRAHEDAAALFWLTLGAKIVGNLGLADDPEGEETHFEALETASDAAAAVVDALVEACAAEAVEDTLRPTGARCVSSLAALRFLRSEAGAAAAPRLVELVELVEGGDADAADARRASAAMRLVTSAMACPLASATFAPWLPSLAASATARRATSPEAAALVAALRIAPVAADAADVPAAVVREVSARFPRGRLAFRKALAENALRAAETAVADGSADFDAVAAEAATRLFDAAVRGIQEETASRNLVASAAAPSVSAAKASARRRRTDANAQTPSRPFPTRALGAYALRLSRVFAGASGDARGVGVVVAAADAMASLAARYAEAGHMASASVDAAVVTRLCVSVSLAAIALPAPACVAAGVRLATAAGLTSSTRLTPGVAPAVVAALDGAKGASPPEAAAALFSRVLFLTPEAEEEERQRGRGGRERGERRDVVAERRARSSSRARRSRGDPGCRVWRALRASRGRRRRRVPGRVCHPDVRAALVAVHRVRAGRGAVARVGADGHRPRRRDARPARRALRRARARRVLERARDGRDAFGIGEARAPRVARDAHAQQAQPPRLFPGRLPRHERGGVHLRASVGAGAARAGGGRGGGQIGPGRAPGGGGPARGVAGRARARGGQGRLGDQGPGRRGVRAGGHGRHRARAGVLGARLARRHRRARRRRGRRAPRRRHAARRPRRERGRQGAPGALGPGEDGGPEDRRWTKNRKFGRA
jgi:hypothetical protein